MCGLQTFDVNRKPVEIFLVLDRSASMEDGLNDSAAVEHHQPHQVEPADPGADRRRCQQADPTISWGMKAFPEKGSGACEQRHGHAPRSIVHDRAQQRRRSSAPRCRRSSTTAMARRPARPFGWRPPTCRGWRRARRQSEVHLAGHRRRAVVRRVGGRLDRRLDGGPHRCGGGGHRGGHRRVPHLRRRRGDHRRRPTQATLNQLAIAGPRAVGRHAPGCHAVLPGQQPGAAGHDAGGDRQPGRQQLRLSVEQAAAGPREHRGQGQRQQGRRRTPATPTAGTTPIPPTPASRSTDPGAT